MTVYVKIGKNIVIFSTICLVSLLIMLTAYG